MALPVAVGAPLRSIARRAAVPATVPTVLIDDRHAEGRAFGSAFAARGALVYALSEGDVTALWRESIGPVWRQAPIVLAGLTRPPALFCLEQLGWALGRRVVFYAEHLVSVSRAVRHQFIRTTSAGPTANTVEWSNCSQPWPSQLASLVARHAAVAKGPRPAPTGVDLAPSLPADAQLLTSWIISPA